MKTLICGIGCFWVENKFKNLKGIISTEVGYCGGKTSDTNYEKVCSGECDSAEVVKVNFDEKRLSEEDLLRFVFSSNCSAIKIFCFFISIPIMELLFNFFATFKDTIPIPQPTSITLLPSLILLEKKS